MARRFLVRLLALASLVVGYLIVFSGLSLGQLFPFAFLRVLPTGDPCEGTPAIGTVCTGGARYAGIYNGSKYMVTPGACTDSVTPTCSGGADTVTKAWGYNSTTISGPTNTTDGYSNTLTYPGAAAVFCRDMVYGGYDDWFLPAQTEMTTVLFPNRVALGGFAAAAYWSSTWQADNNANSVQVNMSTGAAANVARTGALRVRCVRVVRSGSLPPADYWPNFTDTSSFIPVSSFTNSWLSLEFTVTVNSGSPTVTLLQNGQALGGTYSTILPHGTTVRRMEKNEYVGFLVAGAIGASATIQIRDVTSGSVLIDSTQGTADGCGGTSWSGHCLYMAYPTSCTQACSIGGGYNTATRTVIGDLGTNANCQGALAALGSSVTVNAKADCTQGWGCYFDSSGVGYRCTNIATDPNATLAILAFTACICNY